MGLPGHPFWFSPSLLPDPLCSLSSQGVQSLTQPAWAPLHLPSEGDPTKVSSAPTPHTTHCTTSSVRAGRDQAPPSKLCPQWHLVTVGRRVSGLARGGNRAQVGGSPPTSPSNLAGCSVSPSPSSLGRRPRPRGALTMSAPSPPQHRLHPPARPCLCLVSLLLPKTEEGGVFTSPDKLRDAVSPPKRLRLIALPRRKSSEVFLVVG